MVAHAYHLRIKEAGPGGSVVQGKPGIHTKTLSKTTQNKREQTNKSKRVPENGFVITEADPI